MNAPESSPEMPSPELIAACRNLYDVMSQPFEGNFSSFGYSLELTATPEKDATLYLPGGVKEVIEDEFGLTLDREGQWRILFHHDEPSNRLRADSVRAPFTDSKQQKQALIFKQLPSIGYVTFTEQEGGSMQQWLSEDQQLERDVFNRSKSPIIDPDTMSSLLDEAGFRLEVPNTPESRYVVAKNLDDIENWKRRERITVPLAPDMQLLLIKESIRVVSGDRHDNGGSLTAYSEVVHPDGSREQLVITIPIDGGIVEAPEIKIRKLHPSSDPSDIAKYGPNAYQIVEETEAPLTTELVDTLSNDLMEDLGDVS